MLALHGVVEPTATADVSMVSGVLHATVSEAVDAVEIPECIGRGRVTVDGTDYAPLHGPFIVRLTGKTHVIDVQVSITSYEARLTCSRGIVVGRLSTARRGFYTIDFPSPEPLGGHAVVYVPHEIHAPAPMLVGLHPWNGSMWTYAAMGELIKAADASDVVLLMPSGLGNSLYTAKAEAEALRAIDAAEHEITIDPRRVSIWGASMGGAGATTIGFHHPDMFASITSFFGDSRYDLSTYVRSILPTEADAHAVNALDIVENVRHVPVRLFHGEADTVSPIAQSENLAAALTARSYDVAFRRVPGLGHSGKLVAAYIDQVVSLAAAARSPEHPSRVTFRSVRPVDTTAYGVRLVRRQPGDAFIDVEAVNRAVHVISSTNVSSIMLSPCALGLPSPPPVVTIR